VTYTDQFAFRQQLARSAIVGAKFTPVRDWVKHLKSECSIAYGFGKPDAKHWSVDILVGTAVDKNNR
jgi:hypothetical protein